MDYGYEYSNMKLGMFSSQVLSFCSVWIFSFILQ